MRPFGRLPPNGLKRKKTFLFVCMISSQTAPFVGSCVDCISLQCAQLFSWVVLLFLLTNRFIFHTLFCLKMWLVGGLAVPLCYLLPHPKKSGSHVPAYYLFTLYQPHKELKVGVTHSYCFQPQLSGLVCFTPKKSKELKAASSIFTEVDVLVSGCTFKRTLLT